MHDALQRQGEGPLRLRGQGAGGAISDGALRGQLRGRPHQPDPQHDPQTQREFGFYTTVSSEVRGWIAAVRPVGSSERIHTHTHTYNKVTSATCEG